ncbi:MAG: MBL fold metallo-hydrolase [Lachnospiraceae bacterium]|nr:MBL fold metallo-hydrolase [Lachnospiraceae bacterium]
MKILFIGADHEVTGSCHYVEANGKHILVDCGMEQGEDIYENYEIPINPSDIDYVLLTHAHIDHTGLLPLMYARGFRGTVITTDATRDLCDIMLRDSAHIQMFEAEWRNRKAKRAGQNEIVPLYDLADVIGVMKLFHPCHYDEILTLEEGIEVRFSDVGHLLGSACIELFLEEGGVKRTIVFSGDVGNINQPLVKDPTYLTNADYVVMECTYGDRTHEKRIDYAGELADIIEETFNQGGNVVIPCFAVGRTQEMLYFMRKIKEERRMRRHLDFPVYVDSPLAVEATNIFHKHMINCLDEEGMELIRRGINPIGFPNLKIAVSSDESKHINANYESKVILSASGMCEAGRIRHHLKHNLWRKECTVLFVGYQAVGTLGRRLLDGAENVNLFGETIEVQASIRKLDGISGHADQQGLIEWVKAFKPKPKCIFIVHGEDNVCNVFANLLTKDYGYKVAAPYSGTSYDLITGEVINEASGKKIISQIPEVKKTPKAVYARLIAAGQRLATVIRHNEGGANKDLAKFADQINALCDKWDR